MVYEYVCPNQHTTYKVMSIDEFSKLPEETRGHCECEECGADATRVWGNNSTIIPPYMRATKEGNDHTTWSNKMKHAPRPSGKSKTLY